MTNEEAIKVLNMVEAHGHLVIQAKEMAIKALSVPERENGEWIRISTGCRQIYVCNRCHRTIEVDGIESLVPMKYPFCHCGADMRGGKDNGKET